MDHPGLPRPAPRSWLKQPPAHDSSAPHAPLRRPVPGIGRGSAHDHLPPARQSHRRRPLTHHRLPWRAGRAHDPPITDPGTAQSGSTSGTARSGGTPARGRSAPPADLVRDRTGDHGGDLDRTRMAGRRARTGPAAGDDRDRPSDLRAQPARAAGDRRTARRAQGACRHGRRAARQAADRVRRAATICRQRLTRAPDSAHPRTSTARGLAQRPGRHARIGAVNSGAVARDRGAAGATARGAADAGQQPARPRSSRAHRPVSRRRHRPADTSVPRPRASD